MQAFLGQLLLGLVNGSFYAMLSLGLAVIFWTAGLTVISSACQHRSTRTAPYVTRAAGTFGLNYLGGNYWFSPTCVVGVPPGLRSSKTMPKWLYQLDHPIYGLLTFGLSC